MAGKRKCTPAEKDAHILSTPIIERFRASRLMLANESGNRTRRGFGKRRMFHGVYYLNDVDGAAEEDEVEKLRATIRKKSVRLDDRPADIQPFIEYDSDVPTEIDEQEGEYSSDLERATVHRDDEEEYAAVRRSKRKSQKI